MSAMEFSLDNTIGCLFLTAIFTTALWATSTVQVYFYYDRYSRNDALRLKLHVMLVWLLDTAHQVATLRGLYMLFVKQFGNIFSIDHFDRNTFPLITILTAIVNAVVQALFIIRIWHLSKRSKLLTGIAIILVLAQFGITITYFAVIYPLSEATELSSVINIERAMSATTAFVDTAIGAVLVFLLHTNRSGFKRTDSVINHLIFYTVERASHRLGRDLTLIVSLALPKTLFYYLFSPNNAPTKS